MENGIAEIARQLRSSLVEIQSSQHVRTLHAKGLSPAMMDRPNEGLFSQDSAQQSGFSLGQRVRHPKFGEGVVMNAEGSGHHTRVQVNFDEGAKWLVLAYAPLEAC